MSGWIKLEKDRRDDPRVLRMARQLRDAGVTHERFTANATVTLVLGCLDVLWSYADTHVREDDTLDLGEHEIDELVGLKGFCRLVPSDWLEILDDERVKLPSFHDHNGTESKRRALTQKRMARHRNASVTQKRNDPQRASVTPASPDQDQDQTRPDPECKTRAREPEFTVAPRGTRIELDDGECFEHLTTIKAKYPPHAVRENWIGAEKAARELLETGQATWAELEAAVERYSKVCRATRRVVMNPVNFFTAEDRPWSQAWPIPRKDGLPPPPTDAETLRKLVERRASIGLGEFREPRKGETADQYRAAQDAEWNRLQRERDRASDHDRPSA